MTLNLIHFPNFRKSFFGAASQTDILTRMMRIRDEIGCRHILHAYRSRLSDSARGFLSDLTVVTSVPNSWATKYATANYFKIDPLFQDDSPFFHGEVTDLVYDLKRDLDKHQGIADMFRDAEKHGLGNLHVAVTARLAKGFAGCSRFSFQLDDLQESDAFIQNMRPKLLAAAGTLHVMLCGGAALSQSVSMLTQRELDCLRWAANGKTDGEIAEILSIARWTVVTYLQNAKIKLNCSNRTSAVATALSLGIIDMPEITHLVGQ